MFVAYDRTFRAVLRNFHAPLFCVLERSFCFGQSCTHAYTREAFVLVECFAAACTHSRTLAFAFTVLRNCSGTACFECHLRRLQHVGCFFKKKGVHVVASAGQHRCPGLLTVLIGAQCFGNASFCSFQQRIQSGPILFFQNVVGLTHRKKFPEARNLTPATKCKKKKRFTVLCIYMHVYIYIYLIYTIIQTIARKTCTTETLRLFLQAKS